MLESSSGSGCPLAVPQQLSHGHVLVHGLSYTKLPESGGSRGCVLWATSSPGLCSPRRSELVSSITSGARMDERWDFGEIKKSCLSFSIIQAGAYAAKFWLCGQLSRNISSGKTSDSRGPIWQQFSPQVWIWTLQLQPAAVGLQ